MVSPQARKGCAGSNGIPGTEVLDLMILKIKLKFLLCPGGEIGRRTVFRWQHPKGCAGSNPVPGTINRKSYPV